MIISDEALEMYGVDYTKFVRSDITFEQYINIRIQIENMVIKQHLYQAIKTKRERQKNYGFR